MVKMHLFEDEAEPDSGRWVKSVADRQFQVLLVSQVSIAKYSFLLYSFLLLLLSSCLSQSILVHSECDVQREKAQFQFFHET